MSNVTEETDVLCFVKLILIKIIKIVTTRGHILKLERTKLNFGAYSAPPDSLAGFKVVYF